MEQIEDMLAPYRNRPIAIGGASAYGGTSSYYLGLLASRLGRPDDAIEHLEEAARLNQESGALPWLARSRYELAKALATRGKDGDAERAGQLLAEAGRAAERLGMADVAGPDGRGAEAQQPPAIAGRMTTVSPSATAVSSPSSTLTSSSLR